MIREVKIHYCRAETTVRDTGDLDRHRSYYSDDPKFEFFKVLPVKCTCKEKVSLDDARKFLDQGKALKVYKPKKSKRLNEARVDRFQIVIVVDRPRTPRVDLTTKADIERAYGVGAGGQEKYIRLIEEIHKMIMSERAKLIIPFRDDPFEGRALFPFGADQKTNYGGYR